jgi:hypothetical protein
MASPEISVSASSVEWLLKGGGMATLGGGLVWLWGALSGRWNRERADAMQMQAASITDLKAELANVRALVEQCEAHRDTDQRAFARLDERVRLAMHLAVVSCEQANVPIAQTPGLQAIARLFRDTFAVDDTIPPDMQALLVRLGVAQQRSRRRRKAP